jgi:CheY-like chemotaxis protein
VLDHPEPILRPTLTEQQKLVLHVSEGVITIRADPAQLDQVLLNLTINARDAMPDGGTVTLEEYPDLPVVFMSGYTDDDVARRGLLDAGMSFLEKPISPEILTRKMRQVLDGAPRKT